MSAHLIHKAIEWGKQYYDSHRSMIDSIVGGGIGLGTSIGHYWDHFKEDEMFKLLDGALGTFINTVIGAVVLWALHKFIFKTKKEKK